MSGLNGRGYAKKHARGKSEPHRAGCRLITGGGDSKESATEIDSLKFQVMMERWGKSPPHSWRHEWLCKPHPEQGRKGKCILYTSGCSLRPKRRWSHMETYGVDR